MARCKFYQRQDSGEPRYVVYLYYQGKKWTRTWCDDGTAIDSRGRADRITNLINGDLEKLGKGFNPRKWFGYDRNELNFGPYADKWLRAATKEGRYARGSLVDVERYVDRAVKALGAMDMRTIKQAHIKDYLSSLSAFAPATRKVHLDFLHTIFADAAVDYEDVITVPHFPSVEIPEKEVKWITEEWQEKIIRKIPEHDRPIFRFLCAWPVRTGEAMALQWNCVQSDKGLIVIKRKFGKGRRTRLEEFTKTRKVRYVPITDDIAEILQAVKKNRLRSPYVFIDKNGLPYTGHISGIWNKAREKAGCPEKVTLYQGTKHSFITQHSDQLLLASKAAGHTSLKMTQRYEGTNVENLRKLVRGRPDE